MAEQKGTGTASGLIGLMRRPMALSAIVVLLVGIGALAWFNVKRRAATEVAGGTASVETQAEASASQAGDQPSSDAASGDTKSSDTKSGDTKTGAASDAAAERAAAPTVASAAPAEAASPLTPKQREALAKRAAEKATAEKTAAAAAGTKPEAIASASPASSLTAQEKLALSSGQEGDANRPVNEPMPTTAAAPMTDRERQALGIPTMTKPETPATTSVAAATPVEMPASAPGGRGLSDLERQALGIPSMGSGAASASNSAGSSASEEASRPLTDLERQALGIPSMSKAEPTAIAATNPAAKSAAPRFNDDRAVDTAARLPAGATANAAPPSLPSGATFTDSRPLGAPAPAAPSFRDERQVAAQAPNTAAAGGMFKDDRAVDTGRLPENAPRLPASAVPSVPGLPAGQTFADARPLTAQPTVQPTFRDERELAGQPSFRDQRAITGLSFQDSRPVGAPAFRDDRTLAAGQLPGGVQPPQVVAAAPTAGVLPPGAERAQSGAEGTGPATSANGRRPTTLVAIVPPPSASALGNCEQVVTSEPLDAGRMAIRMRAPCNRNETVQIRYAGVEIVRQLDGWGSLEYVLDAFAGRSSTVELRFANGVRRQLPVNARDLDRVSKIAVVWRAPVNLDLHVFEYGARLGDSGHVWERNASTAANASTRSQSDRRGLGYLSASDNDGSLGDKLEVYTFFHNDQQTNGTIGLALDYESRGELPAGETCGNGALSEIEFQLTLLPRGGEPTRQAGVLTRVDCGVRLAAEARFAQTALPSLRIRN